MLILHAKTDICGGGGTTYFQVFDNSQKGVFSSNLTLHNVYLNFLLGGQIPPRLQISLPLFSLGSFIDSKNKTPPLNITTVLVCSTERTCRIAAHWLTSTSPILAHRCFRKTTCWSRASLYTRSSTAPCVLKNCERQSPFLVAIPTA